MFERFTQKAQQVIYFAEQEARNMNHHAVGTEHILLGILDEGQGIAAKALTALGVDLEKTKDTILQMVAIGAEPVGRDMLMTPRAKRVFTLAQDEAVRWGVNYIGTEHILLGLLREDESIASRVLAELNIDPDKIRKQVVALLGGANAVENTMGYGKKAIEQKNHPRKKFQNLSIGQNQ